MTLRTQLHRTQLHRRLWALLLTAGAALLLDACLVTAVKPFYFPGDIVEVTDLLGTWNESEGKSWTLEQNAEGYLWRIVENGEETVPKETVLEATFFSFQGSLFFDFMLSEASYAGDDDLLLFAIRTHFVAKVRHEGDQLYIEDLDYAKLEEALKIDPESGAARLDLAHHVDSDDRIILTGSTTELQGFLSWCLAREGCLGSEPDEVTVLTRRN